MENQINKERMPFWVGFVVHEKGSEVDKHRILSLLCRFMFSYFFLKC